MVVLRRRERHPLLRKSYVEFFSLHFHFQIDMRAFDIIYPLLPWADYPPARPPAITVFSLTRTRQQLRLSTALLSLCKWYIHFYCMAHSELMYPAVYWMCGARTKVKLKLKRKPPGRRMYLYIDSVQLMCQVILIGWVTRGCRRRLVHYMKDTRWKPAAKLRVREADNHHFGELSRRSKSVVVPNSTGKAYLGGKDDDGVSKSLGRKRAGVVEIGKSGGEELRLWNNKLFGSPPRFVQDVLDRRIFMCPPPPMYIIRGWLGHSFFIELKLEKVSGNHLINFSKYRIRWPEN